MAHLIPVDGPITPLTNVTQAGAQRTLNGPLQQVSINPTIEALYESGVALGITASHVLLVNADGAYLHLAPNGRASYLAGQMVLGPAVLITRAEMT